MKGDIMKKTIIVIGIIMMILLSGCNKKGEEPAVPEQQEEKQEAPAKEETPVEEEKKEEEPVVDNTTEKEVEKKTDPYDLEDFEKKEKSSNLDDQKGIQIYLKDGKTMIDGMPIAFPEVCDGFLQLKKDRVIRIRKAPGTSESIVGHIYEYAIVPFFAKKEKNGYTWYAINKDQSMWIADDGSWMTIVSK